MSASDVAPAVSPAKKTTKSPKKAAAGVKKAAPSHPSYKQMVKQAVKQLKEPKGSSRQAVLKYVAAHYKIGEDASKISHRVSVALKKCIEKGELKNTKGSGAAGSFVLPPDSKAVKKVSPAKKVVKKSASKPKAAVAKKSPKKAKASPKKAKVAKKSPKKVAAKKPKSPAPKVKKAKSPKKKAAKKAAPKK